MSSTAFKQTITALSALGPLRVWSLIVSIFGDLAQSQNATIEGTTLSAILSEIGIRPEATRVALHRLRNEGWIASVKTGRTSQHSLTPLSRDQSAQASGRIYPNHGNETNQWVLVLLAENTAALQTDMQRRGFLPLMPRTYIGSAAASPPSDALVQMGGAVPTWLPEQLDQPEIATDYHALYNVLKTAQTDLPPERDLSPLQIAVLRCMIVHCWRRIVLKHPDLPRALFPDDWQGHHCRDIVAALLEAYPRPDLNKIT